MIGCECVEIRPLYWEPKFSEEMRLERWGPGTVLAERAFSRGAELFVIDGTFQDDEGRYRAGGWLRLPPGSSHQPRTVQGCTVYLKVGGVAGLRSG